VYCQSQVAQAMVSYLRDKKPIDFLSIGSLGTQTPFGHSNEENAKSIIFSLFEILLKH